MKCSLQECTTGIHVLQVLLANPSYFVSAVSSRQLLGTTASARLQKPCQAHVSDTLSLTPHSSLFAKSAVDNKSMACW